MPVSNHKNICKIPFENEEQKLVYNDVCLGLAAFEHEGIQNITQLKEQLVAGGHEQSAAISKRHGDVLARWQRLLADSAARKQRLLQLQDQFRQIEELYLTFAKKVCTL